MDVLTYGTLRKINLIGVLAFRHSFLNLMKDMNNRIIKFRAWLPGLKVIGNVVKLTGSNEDYKFNSVLAECFINGRQQFYESSEFELLKFSGLHDKHGKEIWEGDVVNTVMSNFITYNFKSVVSFKDGCFGIIALEDLVLVDNAKGKFKSFDGCDTTKLIEVIGSIHSTPELLNL